MAQLEDKDTVEQAVGLQQQLVDTLAQLTGDLLAGRTPRLNLVGDLRTAAGDYAQLLEATAGRRSTAKLTSQDVETLRRWGAGRQA